MRWPEVRSTNQSAPVFIFSAGWRSGSTFLQRWLMTDKTLMVWGEPYRHAGLIESLARPLAAFTANWPKDEYFDHHGPDNDLSSAWIANLYPSLTDFMNAHISYLERLFLEPALALGRSRWGLKAVTLGTDHAGYLKWLFPRAKFLFIYRNPYAAYGSYKKFGGWYKSWPAEPVFTATGYGTLWRELVTDFVQNCHKVDGLLLPYEEFATPATRERLEQYLGVPLAEASSLARISDAPHAVVRAQAHPHWIPKLELVLLKRQVEPLGAKLGYRPPR
ncbi:MAG: sulfotransferase [Terriglobia bacterium]